MRALLLSLTLALAAPAMVLAQDVAVAAHAQVLPPVRIVGRRPSPVTLFLPRARVRFDTASSDHHAVDRIVDSVRHAPF